MGSRSSLLKGPVQVEHCVWKASAGIDVSEMQNWQEKQNSSDMTEA